MGYACPVCDAEQADAIHLANHLAITASLGRTDHLEWLDEHAPDWSDSNPKELGAVVREHAREVEVPEFVDPHDHELRDRDRPDLVDPVENRVAPANGFPAGTQAVLAEARELTRRMYETEEDDPERGGRIQGGDPERGGRIQEDDPEGGE